MTTKETYLPTYIPTYLPTWYLPTYLPTSYIIEIIIAYQYSASTKVLLKYAVLYNDDND